MNHPVPEEHHQRFDVVVDGGALEHVFNYPVAIRNCMEMVKVGGRVVLVTTVNNWLGHGFYQFSPSLFFGIFSEENGFELERTFILENDANYAKVFGYNFLCETAGPWYEVAAPRRIGERVLLVNSRPTMLLVRARRTRIAPIFARYPEESGYEEVWRKYEGSGDSQSSALRVAEGHWWARRLSPATRLHLHLHLVASVMRRLNPLFLRRIYRRRSLRNRKFYRKVDSPGA